jgi:hypothetical protein
MEYKIHEKLEAIISVKSLELNGFEHVRVDLG